MVELKLNYSKTGMQDRSKPQWKWYTAKVGSLLYIHVHNKTDNWSYKISVVNAVTLNQNGFNTKEDAFEAAKERAKTLLNQALEEL